MGFQNRRFRIAGSGVAATLVVTLTAGCATYANNTQPRATRRDKTAKGAGIGAAAGAAGAILAGKRQADEILAGAAIGAAVGAGVGLYMDAQEEKLARIVRNLERMSENGEVSAPG